MGIRSTWHLLRKCILRACGTKLRLAFQNLLLETIKYLENNMIWQQPIYHYFFWKVFRNPNCFCNLGQLEEYFILDIQCSVSVIFKFQPYFLYFYKVINYFKLRGLSILPPPPHTHTQRDALQKHQSFWNFQKLILGFIFLKFLGIYIDISLTIEQPSGISTVIDVCFPMNNSPKLSYLQNRFKIKSCSDNLSFWLRLLLYF